MKPTGRPKIEIDKEVFEKLCGIWCTLEEIAGWFKCSDTTVQRFCKKTYKDPFEGVYKKYAGVGAVSLRRKQFELAQKGNVALLIWLGKQHLGQREPSYNQPIIQAAIDGKAEIVIKWTDEINAGDAQANVTANPSGSGKD